MTERGGWAFTKQDLLTFVLGLAGAILGTVAMELIKLEGLRRVPDWQLFLNNLLLAMLPCIGRYLVTYLFQRGFWMVWRRHFAQRVLFWRHT